MSEMKLIELVMKRDRLMVEAKALAAKTNATRKEIRELNKIIASAVSSSLIGGESPVVSDDSYGWQVTSVDQLKESAVHVQKQK